MKERRKRKNLKNRWTDQHQSQKAITVKMTVTSCQTSGCRESATLTFGPFQDHPYPPIGNIFEKLQVIIVKNDRTQLKSEPITCPSFQLNKVQI